MESSHKMNSFLLLRLLHLVLLFSTTTRALCPSGCICEPVDTLNCTHVDKIPEYSAKQDINNLYIYNHSIMELTSNALQGFTNLKTLYLVEGNITRIEHDAFDVFNASIININLDGNSLTEIPVGLFKDMPLLRELNLTRNRIEVIKTETFVNLNELLTLMLRLNNIFKIEDGALKNVPKLDNINLFDNKLTVIPVRGLMGATNCRKLDVSFNRIAEIPEDLGGQLVSLDDLDLESNPITSMTVFPEISKSLTHLNLQFTSIPTISSNAWDKVPNLKKLYLSGSLFEELNQAMFLGLPNVDTIFLMSLKNLKKVGPNTFSNMTKLESLHLTFNKKLSDIDDTAFASTNLSYVHLRENSLTTFEETMLNWTYLKYVSLERNPVNCDCRLAWMFKPEYSSVRPNFSDMTCELPAKFAYKKLMNLQQSDLSCQKTHAERLATAIIVAVFCVVFMVACMLLFRCRKNITMRCRRYFRYKKYQNDLVFTVDNDTAIGELDDGDTRPLKEIQSDTN